MREGGGELFTGRRGEKMRSREKGKGKKGLQRKEWDGKGCR